MTTPLTDIAHRASAAPGLGVVAKRGLDLALAIVLVVCLLPVCLVIALAIKLTSDGPVLFCHERIGRDGRSFLLLKFRTMRDGTNEQILADPIERHRYVENGFKLPSSDARITGLGRFLRKSSLDELPQLINVIVGHMSLVGIRPLVADELQLRGHQDQLMYCSMRPGMTGLWQVEGRSAVERADRIALDRRYVEGWSLWRDGIILLRTPLAVLRARRAH